MWNSCNNIHKQTNTKNPSVTYSIGVFDGSKQKSGFQTMQERRIAKLKDI